MKDLTREVNLPGKYTEKGASLGGIQLLLLLWQWICSLPVFTTLGGSLLPKDS